MTITRSSVLRGAVAFLFVAVAIILGSKLKAHLAHSENPADRWLLHSDDWLGVQCHDVFSMDVDCAQVAITGDGVDEDWSYRAENRGVYDPTSGYIWWRLNNGLYRVSFLTDGPIASQNSWSNYQTYCAERSSSLCWENSQDRSWTLCFQVKGDKIAPGSPSDCSALE